MYPTVSYENKELLRRIAEGDEEAFTLFFRLLSPQVLTWAAAIVHEPEVEKEILQNVFIRIWFNREQLPDLEWLTAWVKRITLNQSFSWLRAQSRRDAAESKMPDAPAAPDAVEGLSYRELAAEVQAAITNLPSQRRKIFIMSREQGLSTAEIAEELQLSPGTVRNAISTALGSIRHHLEATGRYVPLFLLFFK